MAIHTLAVLTRENGYSELEKPQTGANQMWLVNRNH